MAELLLKKEVFNIIGCAMEVHKELGPGFLESVYQEALEIEFQKQGIPYIKELELNVFYKGIKLNKRFSADFACYDCIMVELKALSQFTGEHEQQILNYLKTTRTKVGVLINFGTPSLEYKRFVNFWI